jgi:hypothetical protein
MVPSIRRFAPNLLLTAILCAFGGLGCAGNPSYFPHLLPEGPITRTHAKPPGRGNFADFDPEAARLEVRPLRSTTPVGTQYLVIATVLDEKGKPRRKRRVEWMLEGAGNVVEVDESGYTAGRGYKVDNKYAVSYTDFFEHTITRGNNNSNDDFTIHPGQSWCIITSNVEGDTKLTVYAPEIYDWDKRTVVATIQWTDCQWQLPAPMTARVGGTQAISTQLFHHTERTPLPNYRVRYTLLDGPPAGLLPSREREVVVTSDLSGHAKVDLAQLSPTPGVNRIGVEVIRPSDPRTPGSPPIVLAKEDTTVDWQGPQITVRVDMARDASVNQEIPATVTVTNAGKVESVDGEVRVPIPPGMSVLRAEPKSFTDPNTGDMVWKLPNLGAGRQQTMLVTFKPVRTGPFSVTARAATRDNLTAENEVQVRVEQAQLQLSLDGPKTGLIGETLDIPITLKNPGAGPASKVLIEVRLADGLEVPLGDKFEKSYLKNAISALEAGETRRIPFHVVGRKADELQFMVFVTADGGLKTQQVWSVLVQEPKALVKRSGPGRVSMNRDGSWALTVKNLNTAPLKNAVMRERLPVELTFRTVSDGGQFNPQTGEIVWNFGTLEPGAERVLRYTATGVKPTTRGVLSGTLTAYPNIEQKSENSIEILGVPALKVEVAAGASPIEVGTRTSYSIRVTNAGSLAADGIEVTATASPELKPLGATGQVQGRVNGNQVSFGPINGLQPGQSVTLTVGVQAVSEGDGRFKIETKMPTMPTPQIDEEATRVIAAIRRN